MDCSQSHDYISTWERNRKGENFNILNHYTTENSAFLLYFSCTRFHPFEFSLFLYINLWYLHLSFCVNFFRDFSLKAMKDSKGTFQSSFVRKSLYDKLQDVLCCYTVPNKYKELDTKLERKMIETKRNASGRINFKSIDSIIMKFPQFREGLKEIGDIFKQYDEDSNGTIDNEELKKCLRTLEFSISDEEIDDLFCYCDMDENEGIQFKEFIVLLCLIYLLMDSSTSPHTLKMYYPQIEGTFNTIIEVFLFLDKNGVGKLKREDVVRALNEASPKEKSPSHITWSRFKEMDWDKNGKVSFKEFLFSFISWVGIDHEDEDPEQ